MRTLYNKILGKIDYLKRAIYFFYCKSDGRQNSIENDKFIFFEINDNNIQLLKKHNYFFILAYYKLA